MFFFIYNSNTFPTSTVSDIPEQFKIKLLRYFPSEQFLNDYKHLTSEHESHTNIYIYSQTHLMGHQYPPRSTSNSHLQHLGHHYSVQVQQPVLHCIASLNLPSIMDHLQWMEAPYLCSWFTHISLNE